MSNDKDIVRPSRGLLDVYRLPFHGELGARHQFGDNFA